MKIITICGSLKFKDRILEIAEELELEGNCVLVPIFSNRVNKDAFTEEELSMLGKMHFEKIKLSDCIYVVDTDSYIGESTKKEIEFAKSQNKEILYDSNRRKCD